MLKDGFYWVRDSHSSPSWQPAELKDGRWWIIGDDGWWPDTRFAEIDPFQIKRDNGGE